MTHRLTTDYAKNYCNRTLIVKVIIEIYGDTVYIWPAETRNFGDICFWKSFYANNSKTERHFSI